MSVKLEMLSHVGYARDQTGPDVDGDIGVAALPNNHNFGLLAVIHACLQAGSGV